MHSLHRFVAFLLILSLLPSAPAPSAAGLGVITFARAALVDDADASAGSTVYDRDRLSTDVEGALRVSNAHFQLQLKPESIVTLRELPPAHASGAEIDIAAGAIDLSATATASILVLADGATLEPLTAQPFLATIELHGPREVHIFVRRGTLNLTYGAESAQLQESQSYALVLDPTDKEIALAAKLDPDQDPKKHPAKRPPFVLIAIAAAIAIAIPFLVRDLESPHSLAADRH